MIGETRNILFNTELISYTADNASRVFATDSILESIPATPAKPCEQVTF